jgi:hypothetical protein
MARAMIDNARNTIGYWTEVHARPMRGDRS